MAKFAFKPVELDAIEYPGAITSELQIFAPNRISAEQREGMGVVGHFLWEQGKPVLLKAGDWIVKMEYQDYRRYTASEFQRFFRPAKEKDDPALPESDADVPTYFTVYNRRNAVRAVFYKKGFHEAFMTSVDDKCTFIQESAAIVIGDMSGFVQILFPGSWLVFNEGSSHVYTEEEFRRHFDVFS